MKKLYGLISDNGDSSNTILWHTNKELVDYLLEQDESYYSNEGSATKLTFPDNFDLQTLGLFISNQSLEEYKKDYGLI